MAEQEIRDYLSRIEKLTLLGAKNVLTIEETALVTGMSKQYIYRLTADKKIPYYKPHGKSIYFQKSEIESWLLQNRVSTTAEINSQAATYVAINR